MKYASGIYDCIFLDRNKYPGKAICSLYEARPMQCRTWPFWPELLESQQSWVEAKSGVDGCPGLDKGKQYNVSEIETQLNSTILHRNDCL